MKFIKLNSREFTKISIFATIYIVTNIIPISQFLNVALFIPLSIIFVPVGAYYLTPEHAFISSIVEGIGSLFLNPIETVGMGIFAILIPVIAITIGSIGFHYRQYTWIPIGFLLFEYIFYLFWYKRQATPFWRIHYLIVNILGSYFFITQK